MFKYFENVLNGTITTILIMIGTHCKTATKFENLVDQRDERMV